MQSHCGSLRLRSQERTPCHICVSPARGQALETFDNSIVTWPQQLSVWPMLLGTRRGEGNVSTVQSCCGLRTARCMQNGAVVNLSSLSAIQVNPDGAAYNIAKAAQDHLTKTLSRKYTSKGVRINSVNPGFVSLLTLQCHSHADSLHVTSLEKRL